jgi:hypothetical protein
MKLFNPGNLISKVVRFLALVGDILVVIERFRRTGNGSAAPSLSDLQRQSQDSANSNGDTDEEPATNEVGVQTGQGDLFETPRQDGPLSRS